MSRSSRWPVRVQAHISLRSWNAIQAKAAREDAPAAHAIRRLIDVGLKAEGLLPDGSDVSS